MHSFNTLFCRRNNVIKLSHTFECRLCCNLYYYAWMGPKRSVGIFMLIVIFLIKYKINKLIDISNWKFYWLIYRGWMNIEWILSEYWMNIEWILSEYWINIEWILNEYWLNKRMNERMNKWWTNKLMNCWARCFKYDCFLHKPPQLRPTSKRR